MLQRILAFHLVEQMLHINATRSKAHHTGKSPFINFIQHLLRGKVNGRHKGARRRSP